MDELIETPITRALIDKLMYQTSMPLASRVVARSHMEPLSRKEMEQYILQHLAIAGVKTNLFARAKIGMMNLIYNMRRMIHLIKRDAKAANLGIDYIRIGASAVA